MRIKSEGAPPSLAKRAGSRSSSLTAPVSCNLLLDPTYAQPLSVAAQPHSHPGESARVSSNPSTRCARAPESTSRYLPATLRSADGTPRLLPTPHSCAAGNAWPWKPTTHAHPSFALGGERVRLARRQWTRARGWEGTVVSSKYKRACSLPACRAVGTASHATTFQGANPERAVLSTRRVCTHESSALPPGIPAVVLRQRVTRRGCNCLGAVSGAWPTEMRTCEPWV